MSPVNTGAGPGREEPLILTAPRRTAVLAAVVAGLTAILFAVVADRGALGHIQRLDDSWLRLMISARDTPLATYWLPVVPGWLSWRLLQRWEYV